MAEYKTTTDPNRSRRTIYVHRLIWMEHHGEIPQGFIIHHINGDKKDNRIENLELVSRRVHILIHNTDNKG